MVLQSMYLTDASFGEATSGPVRAADGGDGKEESNQFLSSG